MRWTEHQQTLLGEMGLRVWPPQPVGGAQASLPPPPAHAPTARAERSPSRPSFESSPPAPLRPPVAPRPAGGATMRPPVAAEARMGSGASAAPVPAPTTDVVAPAATAREQAIARMGWPELRQAVADCQACGLCRGRTQTVFGVGHEQAEVMIVGEAPGEQEDLRGEPFVGPAGQLLDNMLRAVELARQPVVQDGGASAARQVFIANTLKCRPPRNRNPEPAELAQCVPFLQRQIELVRPRLLLASGRYAVNALLNSSEAIGRLRGRVHQYRGIPVVVTYHPAYLLRQLSEKAKAWDDLCLAMDALARTPPRQG